jgi:hypothetical protein
MVGAAEVEGVGVDRRTAAGGDRVQQAPAIERGDAGRVHDVRRDGVAGKCDLSTSRTQ